MLQVYQEVLFDQQSNQTAQQNDTAQTNNTSAEAEELPPTIEEKFNG